MNKGANAQEQKWEIQVQLADIKSNRRFLPPGKVKITFDSSTSFHLRESILQWEYHNSACGEA